MAGAGDRLKAGLKLLEDPTTRVEMVRTWEDKPLRQPGESANKIKGVIDTVLSYVSSFITDIADPKSPTGFLVEEAVKSDIEKQEAFQERQNTQTNNPLKNIKDAPKKQVP